MSRIVHRRLTKSEKEIVSSLQTAGKELFTTNDINALFYGGKGSAQQIYELLYALREKGWVQRIEGGKYALLNITGDLHRNSYLVAMKLVEPACIAYWSALNYYGLTEQLPRTVFVQTPKRKTAKEALDVQYQFITVSPFKFFGIRKEWLRTEARHLFFNITDLEKTLVDCFDYPEYCGGITECAKGLVNAKNLDIEKILSYAGKMKNGAIVKRIGFVAELFGLEAIVNFVERQIEHRSPKFSLLDTSLSSAGRYVRKWRLRINVDEDQLKMIFHS